MAARKRARKKSSRKPRASANVDGYGTFSGESFGTDGSGRRVLNRGQSTASALSRVRRRSSAYNAHLRRGRQNRAALRRRRTRRGRRSRR
jgi:hypothetical protein